MKKNVGGIDKALRFIFAIIFALVGFFVQMSIGLTTAYNSIPKYAIYSHEVK